MNTPNSTSYLSLIGISLALCGLALGCSSSGNAPSLTSSGSNSITKNFSSGSTGVAYTATVQQPGGTGSVIYAGPIGGQTAFQYFNSNIATAISSHASKIVFPTGNYSITPEGGALYHITINGATDLVVDGQGSTLTFQGVLGGLTQGNVQGVTINQSTRVLLANFTVDYDVRIASSGSVQSESAHCGGSTHNYVLVNTATYPMTDSRIQQAKIFNDSNTNLWGLRKNEYYTYASPINYTGATNSFYPCSASFDSAFPTVGHTVTIRHFAYDGNAIGIYGPNTQDITLSGITLYASPAMGIYISAVNRGIAIENCKIIKNPNDSTRLITLAADGIHFNQVGGDIIIENSEISFQGDDGLNIVSKLVNGTTVSGNTITISNSDYSSLGSNLQIGDHFAFYSPSFSALGTAKLLSVSQSASTLLTFDSLSGITTGDWLLEQSLNTARVYIASNNFHDNRERGILARSSGLYISANQFSNNSGPAILLATDGLSFNEGAFAQDVSVVGNSISSANQTQISPATAILEYGAISIGAECAAGSGCSNTLAPQSNLQNIEVVNNTITANAGIGILLSNLTTASISGNSVSDSASSVLQSSFGGAGSAAGSIHWTRSSGLNFGSNSLTRATTNN